MNADEHRLEGRAALRMKQVRHSFADVELVVPVDLRLSAFICGSNQMFEVKPT
ncbi:hypothetical protein IC757_13775 [Wenzhouxiangella sp. AB-CW3]|uniref:hypothetical protein n=1 Tax=Wenzhouxiangella sp. AB-CW3 TaxID=2771012 RepID=UPI00168B3997|nr:hypothetical protein [Wenzhouxiangella sp. AB-CW3]QOC22079.1 hypothetical protein IC757_13775 [Wenzhouxiangella sp. AB-CW3]